MSSTQPRYFGHDITNQQIIKQKSYKNLRSDSSENENQFVLKMDDKLSKIDLGLKNDELYSAHYINQQMDHLFKSESCIKDYIINNLEESSKDNDEYILITKEYRSSILNNIILLSDMFELYDETLFCAAKIIDRYFAKNDGKIFSCSRITNNYKSEMVLIACCALWIACKYQEIYPPQIADFLVIKGKNFTQDDLIKKEAQIIVSIDFDLTPPSSLIFIQRFYQFGCFYINQNTKIIAEKQKQKDILYSLMKYCGEICFMNYYLSLQKPSKIGAAIFYYSCVGTGIFSWQQIKNDGFVKYINNYQMNQLLDIIQSIHKLAIFMEKAEKTRKPLIYQKYAQMKAFCVTKIPSKMYGKNKQIRY